MEEQRGSIQFSNLCDLKLIILNRFLEKLKQYAWATFDTILWSVISVATIIFMACAGIITYLFVGEYMGIAASASICMIIRPECIPLCSKGNDT